MTTNRIQNNSDIPVTQNISAIKEWALCICPSVLLVITLWLPFGFSLIGNIEEWGLLGVFTTHGLFFVADTTSPLAEHSLRPLTVFPQALAYYLDPYSFKYWNILLGLSIVLKGCSISYIVRRLTGSWAWGTVSAFLLILYPADTMQLSYRALHINWALSLVLLGTVVFLYALSINNSVKAYALTMLSALVLASACFMYEASLMLLGLPMLILFAQFGAKSTTKSIAISPWRHAIWFSGAFVYIAYVLYTFPLVKSYQGDVVGESAFVTLKNSLPHLFSIGLLRTMLGGWFDAARITKVEFSNYWYALAVLTPIIGATVRSLPKQRQSSQSNALNVSFSTDIRLLGVGLLLVLLGYVPFLLSPAHQGISQRTFLYASFGGALACLALLHAFHRIARRMSSVILAASLFIAFSCQLYQFHHYTKLSEREREILQSIVSKFDGNVGNKTLLILDKTSQLNNTWMFLNPILRSALTYTFGHGFNDIEVCHVPGSEWQQSDNLLRKGRCEETDSEWVFHYPEPVSGPGVEAQPATTNKHLFKSDVIAVTVDPDGEMLSPTKSSKYTNFLATNDGTLGRVYRGVIAPPRQRSSFVGFNDDQMNDNFHWGFGDWWSMEKPIAGSGWREAEWKVNSFYHDAVAWQASKEATLLFKFSPDSASYKLSLKFDYIQPKIRTSMTVLVNGFNIPLTWKAENKASGQVSGYQLKKGMNTLTLMSDVDDKFYGLAAKLTWVEIK